MFGTFKINRNNPEIANLEFEKHEFLKNHVFFPTEQAGTNICEMVYQDKNLDMTQLVWLEGKQTDKEQIVQFTPLLCGIVLPMDLIDMIGFINFCVSLHHWLHRL